MCVCERVCDCEEELGEWGNVVCVCVCEEATGRGGWCVPVRL